MFQQRWYALIQDKVQELTGKVFTNSQIMLRSLWDIFKIPKAVLQVGFQLNVLDMINKYLLGQLFVHNNVARDEPGDHHH